MDREPLLPPGCRAPAGCEQEEPGSGMIDREMHRTNHIIRRWIDEYARAMGVEDVTITHGWILRFLHVHRDEEVYQRDVERQFGIARSTTTLVLQMMEKKGYLTRTPAAHDARLKKLQLTELGEEAYQKMHRVILTGSEVIESSLNEEERGQLLMLLRKLQSGISENDILKSAKKNSLPGQEHKTGERKE